MNQLPVHLFFTKLVEELFALRVATMCNWGFPLDTLDLHVIVNAYLTKQNQVKKEFANNILGDWVANFMGRHVLTNTIVADIRRKHALTKKLVKCYHYMVVLFWY